MIDALRGEPQPATSKPNRRWYQCNARLLLVLAPMCIIVLSWSTWQTISTERERREEEARKAVRAVGGFVWYSLKSSWDAERGTIFWRPEYEDKWNSREGKSRCGFASPVLADGFELDLRGKRTTDTGLATVLMHVDGLSPLRTLNLTRTKVTDAGLETMKGLNQLLALDLSGANVTDMGLEHLGGLTQLQWLNLGGPPSCSTAIITLSASVEHLPRRGRSFARHSRTRRFFRSIGNTGLRRMVRLRIGRSAR